MVPGMENEDDDDKPKLTKRQKKRARRKKRRQIEESIVDLTGPDEPINLDGDNDDIIKDINKWVDDKHDWVELKTLTDWLKTKYHFKSWVELTGMRARSFLCLCEN